MNVTRALPAAIFVFQRDPDVERLTAPAHLQTLAAELTDADATASVLTVASPSARFFQRQSFTFQRLATDTADHTTLVACQ